MDKTEKILGYPVTNLSKHACVEKIFNWLDEPKQARFFACANPHSIQVGVNDPLFKTALMEADLLLPDGVGILLASLILGGTIRERVTGNDIFAELNTVLNECGGYSCFFLGSTEKALAEIKIKMAADYPNIKISGVYSPPFKPAFSKAENKEMIRAINAAKPDVLWIGMTAPKQEKWIHQNLSELDIRFAGAIGAVFDFYVGNVKRSPTVFQHLGLEWLPRLLQEPRRLWRRNFVSNPIFLLRVIAQRLRKL